MHSLLPYTIFTLKEIKQVKLGGIEKRKRREKGGRKVGFKENVEKIEKNDKQKTVS